MAMAIKWGVILMAIVIASCSTATPRPKPCHIWVRDDAGHVDCLSREAFERWRERNGI